MQDFICIFLKIIYYISKIIFLTVVECDDVRSCSDSQGLRILRLQVISVDIYCLFCNHILECLVFYCLLSVQYLLCAHLKIAYGIAQICFLAVIQVDDILSRRDRQLIFICFNKVITINRNDLIAAQDFILKNLTICRLWCLYNLIRIFFKIVYGITQVCSLDVIQVDDILSSCDSQGLFVCSGKFITINVNHFITACDHIFKRLVTGYLWFMQYFICISFQIVYRIA